MGSHSKYSTTKNGQAEEDDNKDGPLTGTDVAIGAAVGLGALAAWGISKWLGTSSDPQPERQARMTMDSSSSRSQINLPRDLNNFAATNQTGFQEEDAKWQKPRPGCYKLNTDGSARKQPGKTTGTATAGGLIRDHKGEWVVGFTIKLQVCDGLTSELQGILRGLRLARDLRDEYENLEVETDCDEAVHWINYQDLDLERHVCGNIIRECRMLLEQLGVKIKPPIQRSQNQCANALAKVPIPPVYRSTEPTHVWENVSDLPPTHKKNFQDFYVADMRGSVTKTHPHGTYILA